MQQLPGQTHGNQLPDPVSLADDFVGKNITSQRLYLNPGKQARHIVGNRNFVQGKSILTASPDRLLNQLNSGNFTPVGTSSTGMPIVDFGSVIGSASNKAGQIVGQTSYSVVHVDRGGVHIVPWLP